VDLIIHLTTIYASDANDDAKARVNDQFRPLLAHKMPSISGILPVFSRVS